MTDIALFHSVLGVRPGVVDAARRLRAAGNQVTVVDQYDGRSFDDYGEAQVYAESLGYPALMERALAGVSDIADGFVAIGFSNGAGMAQHVSLQREVSAAALLSGALPLEMLGADLWPGHVPVQVHYAREDPFRRVEWIDALRSAVRASGARFEQFDYPGSGHLFTDSSLPREYDAVATEALWQRVLGLVTARRSRSDEFAAR